MNVWRFFTELWRLATLSFDIYAQTSANFAARVAFTRRRLYEDRGQGVVAAEGDAALYRRAIFRVVLWNLGIWPAILFTIRLTVGQGWLIGYLGIPWIMSCLLLVLALVPVGIIYAVAKGVATDKEVAQAWGTFTNFVKWTFFIELFIAAALSQYPFEKNRGNMGSAIGLAGVLVVYAVMESLGGKFKKFAFRFSVTALILILFFPRSFNAAVNSWFDDVDPGIERGIKTIGAAIASGTLTAREERPPSCVDVSPIDLMPEAGPVEIKTDPNCHGGFISVPPGWRGNWTSKSQKGMEIWFAGTRYPVWVSPETRDFVIDRSFRARGEGPIVIDLYRFGEEPPQRKEVSTYDFGQPGWNACRTAEEDTEIDPNGELEADIVFYPLPGGAPACGLFFSAKVFRHRITAHTTGLEVTVPKGEWRRKPIPKDAWHALEPEEAVAIDGGKILIKGVGQATITALPDPNAPQTAPQDPNQ